MGGSGGDQIFYDEERPYLGRDTGWNVFLNLRPVPRLESRINVDTNRFIDVGSNDLLVFDVNIFRTLTTFQFTDRFLFRNISEYNSFDQRLSLNFLLTYRVNAAPPSTSDTTTVTSRPTTSSATSTATASTTVSSTRPRCGARTAPSSRSCSTSSATDIRQGFAPSPRRSLAGIPSPRAATAEACHARRAAASW